MKIIIQTSVAGVHDDEAFSFAGGDTVEVSDALGADLVNAGHAVKAGAAAAKPASAKREKRTVEASETR